jgi:hypothetical protein
VWAARRYSAIGAHRIASLLKASPEGEGFHPSQIDTLKLLTAADHTALTDQTTEVKRMLTGLLQKLTADR